MKKVFVLLSSVILLSFVLTACGSQATPAATVAPQVVTVVVTQAPAATPTSVPPTVVPTLVATVDPSTLVQKGKLEICSDFPYPPMEFYDDNGNPEGSDVEIGNEIATRMGLQVQWVNTVFDTIIEALQSPKCDLIISDMNITADRNKQISFIKYFQAGQSMLAAKGNPQNINSLTDLCGKSAAAESGTTEVDYLQGTGDYATSGGVTQDCTKAGKQPVNVVVAQKDSDALQQLQSGKVAVYFADSPVTAYYVVQHPDQFQLVGQVVGLAPVGIGLSCGGATDCTNAPLMPFGQAVQTALKSMMSDGTYQKILDKWQLSSGVVTLP
jgi:polar amino acid transport system substrate-binding protein